jgi:hypothetical protein
MVASLCVADCISTAPTPPSGVSARGSTAVRDDPLIGLWRKVGNPPCAAGYAAELRIEPNGLYFGATDPPGAFTWWDSGTWRVKTPGQLALSTANDAVVVYAYSLRGQTLTITDTLGCCISYQRAP